MTREKAIKIIKEFMRDICLHSVDQEALETLIPELKESEDERIRKALIEVFKKKLEKGFEWVEYGIPNRSVLDWLEKQKEQKLTATINGEPIPTENHSVDIPLAEWSEEDERIRKEIYNFFKNFKETGTWKSISDVNTWLAYLEKQKEVGIQWLKSDNVKNPDKPYIDKAGMFYTTDGRMCYASEIEKQKEQKPSIFPPGLGEVHWNPIPSGKDVHKWNLPKDFEEAVYKVANFISPFDSQDELRRVSHCFAEQLMSLAKKELMEKPAEVDESTKRLNDNWMRQHFDDYKEQKPAEWSDEDEKYLNRVINLWVNDFGEDSDTVKWLKSLRPQPKPEWSEEDERMLSRCVKSIESSKQFADSDTFKKAKDNEIDWLENRIKSFRTVKQEWSKEDEKMLKWAIRIIVEYSDIDEEGSEIVQNWLESLRPQPKQEWNEKDEDTINLMIAILRENYSNCLFKTNSANTIRMSAISTDMLIKRIESLRPSWKPSEEQMEALLNTLHPDDPYYCELKSLYEELKKQK